MPRLATSYIYVLLIDIKYGLADAIREAILNLEHISISISTSFWDNR